MREHSYTKRGPGRQNRPNRESDRSLNDPTYGNKLLKKAVAGMLTKRH